MSIEEIAGRRSVSREGTKPLTRSQVERYLISLPGWAARDDLVEKEYRFSSYLEGLEFAFDVGKIAEEQDHHPDILIRWRRVKLTLSTHSVKGLTENDFIIAAKSELRFRRNGAPK